MPELLLEAGQIRLEPLRRRRQRAEARRRRIGGRTGQIAVERALARGDLGDRLIDVFGADHKGGAQAFLAERREGLVDAGHPTLHFAIGVTSFLDQLIEPAIDAINRVGQAAGRFVVVVVAGGFGLRQAVDLTGQMLEPVVDRGYVPPGALGRAFARMLTRRALVGRAENHRIEPFAHGQAGAARRLMGGFPRRGRNLHMPWHRFHARTRMHGPGCAGAQPRTTVGRASLCLTNG